jgi:hypothetical protein
MAIILKEIRLGIDDIKKLISEKYNMSEEMDLIFKEVTEYVNNDVEIVIGYKIIAKGTEL